MPYFFRTGLYQKSQYFGTLENIVQIRVNNKNLIYFFNEAKILNQKIRDL